MDKGRQISTPPNTERDNGEEKSNVTRGNCGKEVSKPEELSEKQAET